MLSGMFMVGPFDTHRKKRRTNWENAEKSGKIPNRTRKDKSGRTSPDREAPVLEGRNLGHCDLERL